MEPTAFCVSSSMIGLVFFDLLALCDQDTYDRAAFYTFSELGKFDVHEEIRCCLCVI